MHINFKTNLSNKPTLILRALFLSALIFIIDTNQALAHGLSEADKATAITGGNLQYIWLGLTHMLTGYDHLAFVFGIVFFLTSFKEIAKYITAFTLGHSITLIYATFNHIQLNHYIIDAIIALSICYIGFHNLRHRPQTLSSNPQTVATESPNNTPLMLAMIFSLGLIHGFGLSTILQQLPLDKDNLLANIISFNIGIELGQLIALGLLLPILYLLRKTNVFPLISKLINGALIICGAALFIMQMQDYAADQSQKAAQPQIKKTTQTKQEATSKAQEHTLTITVPATGGIEYKVLAKKGAVLTYSWEAKDGAALYFDFHGEPKGDTTGYFKSYKIATDKQDQGTQTLPFEGTHGWYWKNESAKPVMVTLTVKGEFQIK